MTNILALAGGVGGAKLAHGLALTAQLADSLTIIVNTGDDFSHIGLQICPDLDTVCYTLAGLANPITGWGLQDESWTALLALKALGAPDWFNLGDRDLATHLLRTHRLAQGQTLSVITRDFCAAWGIKASVLPMSDDAVPTLVHTEQGTLPFQEYFVHQGCQPHVTGFTFSGAAQATPAPGVIEAATRADVVVVCPSNPWVSIGPILAVPGIRAAIQGRPVIAVSPIVGGAAIKGPAAKMYQELGITPSAFAVAEQYQDWISGIIIDNVDQDQQDRIAALGLSVRTAQSIMHTIADRCDLAQFALTFAAELSQA